MACKALLFESLLLAAVKSSGERTDCLIFTLNMTPKACSLVPQCLQTKAVDTIILNPEDKGSQVFNVSEFISTVHLEKVKCISSQITELCLEVLVFLNLKI